MLDLNALQQLKQLKADIKVTKEVFQGKVRGTNGRFGFVDLDDGRQIFLPPDEMNKVFPQDIIEVCLLQDEKDKTYAEVEKKISSKLKRFVGKIIKKGNTLFVEPDVDQMSRWIYLPPKETLDAAEGDFVVCQMQRHPFPNGKAQCRVTKILGSQETTGIALTYVQARFELPETFSTEAVEQAEKISQASDLTGQMQQRNDLRDTPFVTIDSASTLDMDDALYCEKQDNGWLLKVAIADPASFIPENSPLDLDARARATSVYLPGNVLSMLPKSLSQDTFSLLAGQDRLALVCNLSIDNLGQVTDYQFESALVKSAAKLSYQQLAAFYDAVEGESIDDADILANKEALLVLKSCTDQLAKYRLEHNLVMDERPDYRYELDEQQCIVAIHRHDRTCAHRVVEEAMLVTNQCGADLLSQQSNIALYNTHPGFRTERLQDVEKALLEQFPDHQISDMDKLEGFIQAMQLSNTSDLPLRAILSRMLAPGLFSLQTQPHMGMGIKSYLTLTSPIRKYNDLLAHRAIKAILAKTDATTLNEELLEQQQTQNRNARRASQFIESWLNRDYMQGRQQETFDAQIVQVNSMGIRVRLDDTGIEGFIILKEHKPKLSFEPLYLRYQNEEQTFQLQQKLKVQFKDIDERKAQINFVIA